MRQLFPTDNIMCYNLEFGLCVSGKAMIIVVSPLLFETGGFEKWTKKTIVVNW